MDGPRRARAAFVSASGEVDLAYFMGGLIKVVSSGLMVTSTVFSMGGLEILSTRRWEPAGTGAFKIGVSPSDRVPSSSTSSHAG